jgi:hypothetical protein
MRCRLPIVALGFTVATASAAFAETGSPAAAATPSPVRVVYVHPERFTDVGDREVTSPNVRAAFLRTLERHLQRSAAPRLAPGETLTVTITDVDMAGAFEPWRRTGSDVRIVRDIYPPRIELTFKMTDASGATVREGTRKLVGLEFLARPTLPSSDPLVYEKALLDDWLGDDFGALRAAGR